MFNLYTRSTCTRVYTVVKAEAAIMPNGQLSSVTMSKIIGGHPFPPSTLMIGVAPKGINKHFQKGYKSLQLHIRYSLADTHT